MSVPSCPNCFIISAEMSSSFWGVGWHFLSHNTVLGVQILNSQFFLMISLWLIAVQTFTAVFTLQYWLVFHLLEHHPHPQPRFKIMGNNLQFLDYISSLSFLTVAQHHHRYHVSVCPYHVYSFSVPCDSRTCNCQAVPVVCRPHFINCFLFFNKWEALHS